MPEPRLTFRSISGPVRAQPLQQQQDVVKGLFNTLIARPESMCCFVDASKWFAVPGARIVYRQYATLYFCLAIDGNESELGCLDLIQVLVETLDRHFRNVCELDLIFNFEAVHNVVDEIVLGGLVVETNMQQILETLDGQAKLMRQQSDLGAAERAVGNLRDQIQSSLPRP